MSITTFKQLEEEFKKVFLIVDPGILKLIMSVVIGNKLPVDPIWLMMVAASSGGKSELMLTLDKIGESIIPISDLTTNTFASGQKKTGKETSLLHKMKPGSVLVFKDFTSILAKNRESKGEIMAQLREIFDGKYTKRTGTGDDVIWNGKVGALAGSTETVYQYNEDFSAMGDRFIMYSIHLPDRMEVARKAIKNIEDMKEKRLHLQDCVKEYIEYVLKNMKPTSLNLSEEAENDILRVADFCTAVRSGIVMDERDRSLVRFVPSTETPTRVVQQLYSIAKALATMNAVENSDEKGHLKYEDTQIVYKIAFDSIPIMRRMALTALAKYRGGVTTKALATSLNYPTKVVNGWLSQLNGLKICNRIANGNADKWYLKDEYRKIMVDFQGIQPVEDSLEDIEEDPGFTDEQIDPSFQDFNLPSDEQDGSFDEMANGGKLL